MDLHIFIFMIEIICSIIIYVHSVIFTPQAVLLSALLAFGVIVWISQGALHHKYPSQFLPLTTDGCLSNVTTLNETENGMSTVNMTNIMDGVVQNSDE